MVQIKVLVTGFEPFGEEKINPSWEAAAGLPDRIGAIELVKCCVPVIYDVCQETVEKIIVQEKPDAVVCLGQAGKRCRITPEFLAVNCKDAPAADNAGNCFHGERIIPDGPAAYETTLPVRRMVEAMNEARIPASLSYSAGTYVCNNLLYRMLHLAARGNTVMRVGFIHIPYNETQAAVQPPEWGFMPEAMIIRGLIICLEELEKEMAAQIDSL